jgi:beta-N-acetylhexosaminidase
MVDVAGTALLPEERERLAHPRVGGVVLFERNYDDPEQLRALGAEIRAVRTPALLIGVDQEGGRVQRFREGLTRLPPMRALGHVHATDPQRARQLARATGIVIGAELGAQGVDFSFAPVLDLDHGRMRGAIGDRAFHRSPTVVAELAGALVDGLAEAGVAAVGKHFPGHGHVELDSHHDLPVDDRDYATLAREDLVPFRRLAWRLAGVMPAHVVYRKVDSSPAGFSRFWIGEVLRTRLGFRGMVFSDDLSMAAAGVAGNAVDRTRAALAAGCDMALVCNAPEQADRVLATLTGVKLDARRAESMRAKRRTAPGEYERSRELVASLAGAGGRSTDSPQRYAGLEACRK